MNAEERLLAAWDEGQAAPSPGGRLRALLALCGEEDGFATLPLGAANARLLDLRRELFGPRLACLLDCPACGARLELELAVADLRRALPAALPEALTAESGGERARFRLPTWADLSAVAAEVAGESAGDRLLRRCLLELEVGEANDQAGGDDLPWSDALAAAVAAAMEEADPLAELRVLVTCSDCGEGFTARLELADYLWAEIDARAQALFTEVHALARAYGWREGDILALSPARRRVYLELAAGRG